MAKKNKAEKIETEAQPDRDEKSLLADKLTGIAVQQLDVSRRYKQARLNDIAKNVDLYLGKRKPGLKGRMYIPVPIMEGYVDTLMSKIDDPPRVLRKHIKEEDLLAAKKITRQWDVDVAKYDLGKKDRVAKKGAILSGLAVFSIFVESDPVYKPIFDYIHWTNFFFQPGRGQDLEEHLFCGRDDIFRTPNDLKGDIYDQRQVVALSVASLGDEYQQKAGGSYEQKNESFTALGLDPEGHGYVGQQIYNLVEWCMEYEGVRYYLLFDPYASLWVRFEKLGDVFEAEQDGRNLYPYTSWHTEDDINFMNRAPADIMRPVAIAQEVTFNEMLDNLRKRNSGAILYNNQIIDDIGRLDFRRDNVVGVKLKPGQSLNGAVLSMATQIPDITSSLNVIEFLRSFVERETGVTAATKGSSEEDKVGIYFGELQQVADRLGLLNRSYSGCWSKIALRYDWGLWEHLPERTAVKIIGEEGIEWTEIVREDLEPEFDIMVVGGNAEVAADEFKKKGRQGALTLILTNERLAATVSPRWAVEELLRNGTYDEEEIRVAMDVDNYANKELLARAARAIVKIAEGKKVEIEYEANTAFLEKIYKAAVKYRTSKPELFDKLMDFFDLHKDIALENDIRRARQTAPQLAGIGAEGGGAPLPAEEAPPAVNIPQV